jgi:ribosomal protein S17E
MNRVEHDLQQFIEQYECLKSDFDHNLDLIERDIAQIDRTIQNNVCSCSMKNLTDEKKKQKEKFLLLFIYF